MILRDQILDVDNLSYQHEATCAEAEASLGLSPWILKEAK